MKALCIDVISFCKGVSAFAGSSSECSAFAFLVRRNKRRIVQSSCSLPRRRCSASMFACARNAKQLVHIAGAASLKRESAPPTRAGHLLCVVRALRVPGRLSATGLAKRYAHSLNELRCPPNLPLAQRVLWHSGSLQCCRSLFTVHRVAVDNTPWKLRQKTKLCKQTGLC